jgi:hypothetical protein
LTGEEKQAEIVAQETDELAWRVFFSEERRQYLMNDEGVWVRRLFYSSERPTEPEPDDEMERRTR